MKDTTETPDAIPATQSDVPHPSPDAVPLPTKDVVDIDNPIPPRRLVKVPEFPNTFLFALILEIILLLSLANDLNSLVAQPFAIITSLLIGSVTLGLLKESRVADYIKNRNQADRWPIRLSLFFLLGLFTIMLLFQYVSLYRQGLLTLRRGNPEADAIAFATISAFSPNETYEVLPEEEDVLLATGSAVLPRFSSLLANPKYAPETFNFGLLMLTAAGRTNSEAHTKIQAEIVSSLDKEIVVDVEVEEEIMHLSLSIIKLLLKLPKTGPVESVDEVEIARKILSNFPAMVDKSRNYALAAYSGFAACSILRASGHAAEADAFMVTLNLHKDKDLLLEEAFFALKRDIAFSRVQTNPGDESIIQDAMRRMYEWRSVIRRVSRDHRLLGEGTVVLDNYAAVLTAMLVRITEDTKATPALSESEVLIINEMIEASSSLEPYESQLDPRNRFMHLCVLSYGLATDGRVEEAAQTFNKALARLERIPQATRQGTLVEAPGLVFVATVLAGSAFDFRDLGQSILGLPLDEPGFRLREICTASFIRNGDFSAARNSLAYARQRVGPESEPDVLADNTALCDWLEGWLLVEEGNPEAARDLYKRVAARTTPNIQALWDPLVGSISRDTKSLASDIHVDMGKAMSALQVGDETYAKRLLESGRISNSLAGIQVSIPFVYYYSKWREKKERKQNP